MHIKVTSTIGDLADDLAAIPVKFIERASKVVREDSKEGNRIAKAFASEQHSMHGDTDIHYPKSFSAEMVTPLSWEYGPDADKMQGGMSFEYGSRNQKPHLDLARSSDIIGPKFAKDVGDVIDGLFWGAEA